MNAVMKAAVVAVAIAMTGSVSAHAAMLNGSIAIGSQGILPDPGALDQVISFGPVRGATYGVSSGTFNQLTNNNSFTNPSSFGALDFSSPITLPLSGTAMSTMSISGVNNKFGNFSAHQVTVISRSASFLDLYFLGTYTPNFGSYDPNEPSSLRISMSRTGNDIGGYSVSFGGTLAAPPTSLGGTPPANTAVPEPASLAILGAGLLGLGLARRRKVS